MRAKKVRTWFRKLYSVVIHHPEGYHAFPKNMPMARFVDSDNIANIQLAENEIIFCQYDEQTKLAKKEIKQKIRNGINVEIINEG